MRKKDSISAKLARQKNFGWFISRSSGSCFARNLIGNPIKINCLLNFVDAHANVHRRTTTFNKLMDNGVRVIFFEAMFCLAARMCHSNQLIE